MKRRNRLEIIFHWGKGAAFSVKTLPTVSHTGTQMVEILREHADRIETIVAMEAAKETDKDGTPNPS